MAGITVGENKIVCGKVRIVGVADNNVTMEIWTPKNGEVGRELVLLRTVVANIDDYIEFRHNVSID